MSELVSESISVCVCEPVTREWGCVFARPRMCMVCVCGGVCMCESHTVGDEGVGVKVRARAE